MVKNKTQNTWKKAKKIIPGGNMLLSKRPEMILPEKWPTYFSKAKDIYINDLNNNKYLDMMCIVGHNILGYANNNIDQKVSKEIKLGKYINKEWLRLKNKYELNFQIKGIESMTSFVFKKNHLKYKTFITQEMLKNNILATNMIFLTVKHNKKNINRYLLVLEKIFKKISFIEKNGLNIDKLLKSPISHNTFKRLN